MSRPVAIRKLVIEFNMQNLSILRDAVANYHDYLLKVQEFEHPTVLSKKAIKKRIKYLEEFAESIDITDEGLVL